MGYDFGFVDFLNYGLDGRHGFLIFRFFLGKIVFFAGFYIMLFYFLFLAKKESSKEKLRFPEMKLTSKNSQCRVTGLNLRGNFYTVQTAFQLMPAFGWGTMPWGRVVLGGWTIVWIMMNKIKGWGGWFRFLGFLSESWWTR